MATTLQIRHVPEDVSTRLKARAAAQGASLSDFLLAEASRIMSEIDTDTVAHFAETFSDLVTGQMRETVGPGESDPVEHYLEVIRTPLIGWHVEAYHWYVVIGFTVGGLLLALFALKKWRFRVSYWV